MTPSVSRTASDPPINAGRGVTRSVTAPDPGSSGTAVARSHPPSFEDAWAFVACPVAAATIVRRIATVAIATVIGWRIVTPVTAVISQAVAETEARQQPGRPPAAVVAAIAIASAVVAPVATSVIAAPIAAAINPWMGIPSTEAPMRNAATAEAAESTAPEASAMEPSTSTVEPAAPVATAPMAAALG